ncbi:hypothetical protein [Azospirillum doebereinerae]
MGHATPPVLRFCRRRAVVSGRPGRKTAGAGRAAARFVVSSARRIERALAAAGEGPENSRSGAGGRPACPRCSSRTGFVSMGKKAAGCRVVRGAHPGLRRSVAMPGSGRSPPTSSAAIALIPWIFHQMQRFGAGRSGVCGVQRSMTVSKCARQTPETFW